MKTKINFMMAICLLVITSTSLAQKNLAEVNKIKGFYVFIESTPIGEYETLGEISSDGNNDNDIKKSGGQYQSVRDNLIKKARSVNYSADGIILTLVNGGTDKAEIIKFKDGEKNKNKAKVSQIQGMYIFVECQPISEYSYIGTSKKSGGFFSSAQYSAVRDALIKKAKKEFRDKNFDAFILKFVEGGADMIDIIKVN